MGSVPCLPPTETVLGETRREKKKKATLFLMSVAPKDNLDVLQRGDLPRCHEARLPAKQHHAKQEEAAFKGSPVGQRWFAIKQCPDVLCVVPFSAGGSRPREPERDGIFPVRE